MMDKICMWLKFKCLYYERVTQSCDHLQHLRQIFPNQRLVRLQAGRGSGAKVFPENKVATSHISPQPQSCVAPMFQFQIIYGHPGVRTSHCRCHVSSQ